MTINHEDLIAEAREWPRDGVNEGPLINSLADALEASDARLREVEAVIADIDGEVRNFEQSDNDALSAIEHRLSRYKPTK